jgi:cytochrome P460
LSVRGTARAVLGVAALVTPVACSSGDGDAGPAPAFPADYAASYVEVRDCRSSSDHELHRVRVLADAAAAAVYQSRSGDFAEGAVVLKEEHDFADSDCSGDVERWTVMVREAPGSAGDRLDWHWQDIDARRRVKTENESGCVGCHTGCGQPPDGFLGTCTVP